MLGTVLLVFAFVCAVLATWGGFNNTTGRWHLGWASLAFYFAALIFGSAQQLLH